MAPMIADSKVRKKPNTEMFRILASTPPTKEPAIPTRILVKMLWSDWVTFSAIHPRSPQSPASTGNQHSDYQKALCVFHCPLHLADMNSWVG